MNTITSENNPSSSSGTIKSGYKKTPVGIIPEDWELKKLKDITIKIGSGSTPRGGTKVYVEDAIPFIRSQNVKNNTLDISDNVCIDLITHQEMKSTIVYPEDVLLNITGASIGRTCVVPHFITEANVSQHVCIIRLKSSKNVFIQSYLSSFEGQKAILRNQTGGNREGLNHKAVGALHIPIPPLPEQERIASCLTTWDKGIEKLNALIEAKKQQKKGLMQGLFNGQLTVVNGQLIQAKVGECFSENWKKVSLKDVVTRVTKRNEELNDNVVTISAKAGLVKQEEYFNKRVASATLNNYYLIEKGDFCYNKSYSNGYPMGVIKRLNDLDKAVVTTLYICFRAKNNIDTSFLTFYFDNGELNKGLMQVTKEGGRAHGLLNIGIQDFLDLQLVLPPLEEQSAVAEVLSKVDREITLLDKKLKSMLLQKKGLMQGLLTGKKRLV